MKAVRSLIVFMIILFCTHSVYADNGYKNFEASVYTRVFEVLKMKEEEFKIQFKQSPVKRAKLAGLKRNAAFLKCK